MQALELSKREVVSFQTKMTLAMSTKITLIKLFFVCVTSKISYCGVRLLILLTFEHGFWFGRVGGNCRSDGT